MNPIVGLILIAANAICIGVNINGVHEYPEYATLFVLVSIMNAFAMFAVAATTEWSD